VKQSIRKIYNRKDSTFKKFSKLDNEYTDLIKKNLEKDSVVLDIGCGCGKLTASIHKHAKKVVGIDFSEELIKSAKKARNIEYKIMDGERLSFPKDSFDVIISHAVLNKIMCKADKALKQGYRILKPGGKIITKMIYKSWGKEFGFKEGYNKKEIQYILKQIGYKNIDISITRQTRKINNENEIIWLRSTEAADSPKNLEEWFNISRQKGKYIFDDSFMVVYAEKSD